MRVAIIHHPVDFKISCGQLKRDRRSCSVFKFRVIFDSVRSQQDKRLRTEWAMTSGEEEDSVAKETQQVEFIKPMRDLLLLVLLSSSPQDSSQKIINKIQ